MRMLFLGESFVASILNKTIHIKRKKKAKGKVKNKKTEKIAG